MFSKLIQNCNYLRVSILTLILSFVTSGPHERRLLNDLLSNYNVLERPVANESEILIVYFSLTLQQLIDVDEKNQNLVTNMWLRFEWIDSNLRWSPNDYGGITDLRISPDKVWRPDVLLYNSADDKFDGTYHSNVVVRHNGSCLYIPPGIFKSTCKIDITWFPFDDQFCDIKFGSWTYFGSELDLRFSNDSNDGDISPFIPNGEWVLLGMPGARNVQKYECCPEHYIDITYTIGLRRRTLYYGFNLIVPSVIISSMTLLSFTLPPDSGEKLTLGVTILLSMIVFLMQLAEIMPATSDSVSIVGSYFACIMVMVALSVVMTVVVLNFHHRTPEQQHEMPKWIRMVIISWLPMILRIKKPSEYSKNDQKSNQIERNASNKSVSKININRCTQYGYEIHPMPDVNYLDSMSYRRQYYYGHHCTDPDSNTDAVIDVDPFCRTSSPTHMELARISERLKEYESICQKLEIKSRLEKSHFPMQLRKRDSKANQTSSLSDNLKSAHLNELDHSSHASSYEDFENRRQPAYSNLETFDDLLTKSDLFINRSVETSNLTNDTPLNRINIDAQYSTTSWDECLHKSKCFKNSDCFNLIMQELRFLTNRYRREDELFDIINEWKFAAIVIDRLCLIVFSTFAVLSLIVCLASAPHLIV
ncbi:Neuronal acetylcholine receptor subunit alpha-7 [Sarcoptes scabiei]|uniref:Neuronal acetylcholine receptor subunit alpha-7 n=1 Tax=Sarcoptes scabiei TaxID=52283 RepID=A0A834RH77_SARSC|nr:Neuronal acetylcholine receptor subunit alpha-7 [Sarcoptes scabiei]